MRIGRIEVKKRLGTVPEVFWAVSGIIFIGFSEYFMVGVLFLTMVMQFRRSFVCVAGSLLGDASSIACVKRMPLSTFGLIFGTLFLVIALAYFLWRRKYLKMFLIAVLAFFSLMSFIYFGLLFMPDLPKEARLAGVGIYLLAMIVCNLKVEWTTRNHPQ